MNGGFIARNRGSVIIIEDGKVALIKRNNKGSIYYVFPGGGIEDSETPEMASEREAFEELGVKVQVNECICKLDYEGIQYFFLAEILDGSIGTGLGEEYMNKSRDKGTYQPMWVEIESLPSIDVKPREIADRIQLLF